MANKENRNIRIRLITRWASVFHSKLATDREVDDFQTKLNANLNKSTVCDTINALKAESGGGFYAEIMTLNSLANTPDPRPKLAGLQIPVLIMKGQCDNQKWGSTNEYLQLFANHKLAVIQDAGHSISIEQPALYLETIRKFLIN
jgi:proline iminopeptidase